MTESSPPGEATGLRAFGTLPSGAPVTLHTLTNRRGMRLRFLDFGGIIRSLDIPGPDGVPIALTLGFDTLDEYLADDAFIGCLIGRFANRIAGGRFRLAGEEHQLERNDGPNHLHGGSGGFHRQMWQVEHLPGSGGSSARLTLVSLDGDQGYPGRLEVEVVYSLTDADELCIRYLARTDRATPVNLTSHSYFNLSGNPEAAVDDHELTLAASRFTPVDETQIPTGELASVAGTPFDFRSPAAVGRQFERGHPQLRIVDAFDHNWVLDADGGGLSFAARLRDPASGRELEILTDQPGIQMYSGLPGRHGLALEPQHFPDSPNQPTFPGTTLEPGREYRTTSVYRVSGWR